MRKAAIIIAAAVVFALVGFLVFKNETKNKEIFSDDIKKHQAGFYDLEKNIVQEALKPQSKEIPISLKEVGVGITSHHLPLAVSFIVDFYKTLSGLDGPRKTFVIFGPDHLEKCSSLISLAKEPFLTSFGEVEIDMDITEKLIESGAVIDDDCFKGEHSVAVQAILIKYFFPEAKIVPVLLSARTEKKAIAKIVDTLSRYKAGITVISSVDFCHYRDYKTAVIFDDKSEKLLLDLDGDSFDLDHVDSPPAVELVTMFAKNNGLKSVIIGRKNSFDFNGQAENTTGYINAVFAQ